MGQIALRVTGLATGLLLAAAVHGADCYNDEVPTRSDLEPPIPGSSADLLRVSDDDIERMLQDARTYEQKYAASPDPATPQAPAK